MPSLMENAGCIAMEATFNGIPVLASNRGGLPETIGDAGFLFDIPARYTPQTSDVPTAEEVAPWVETIIRLWDDAAEYDRRSLAGESAAKRGIPTVLRRSTTTFSAASLRRPGGCRPPESRRPMNQSNLGSGAKRLVHYQLGKKKGEEKVSGKKRCQGRQGRKRCQEPFLLTRRNGSVSLPSWADQDEPRTAGWCIMSQPRQCADDDLSQAGRLRGL